MQPIISQNYYQIEKAFGFIANHPKISPSEEKLAGIVNLDADEFRQVFTQWSGIDPETFFRYLSPQLTNRKDSYEPDLFYKSNDKRIDSSSLIFDNFLNIIRIDPNELKNGNEPLVINYSVQQSPFGRMMVATTRKGVCRVSFLSKDKHAIDILQSEFPEALIHQAKTPEHTELAEFFQSTGSPETTIDLHVKGTLFQISVWEQLLRIPEGDLGSCSDIAKEIENPKALRAVGSAVGSNPIAYFIPCHRIVPAAGGFGNYRWGTDRKIAMIGWEKLRRHQDQ